MRQATWAWVAYSVLQESFFHAPDHPDARYGSEVRTDLISRLTIPLAVLLVDKFLLDKEPDADRPSQPPLRGEPDFEHRAEAAPVVNPALPGGVAAPAEALFFAAPSTSAPVTASGPAAAAQYSTLDDTPADDSPADVSVPGSGDSFEEDAAFSPLPMPRFPGVR